MFFRDTCADVDIKSRGKISLDNWRITHRSTGVFQGQRAPTLGRGPPLSLSTRLSARDPSKLERGNIINAAWRPLRVVGEVCWAWRGRRGRRVGEHRSLEGAERRTEEKDKKKRGRCSALVRAPFPFQEGSGNSIAMYISSLLMNIFCQNTESLRLSHTHRTSLFAINKNRSVCLFTAERMINHSYTNEIKLFPVLFGSLRKSACGIARRREKYCCFGRKILNNVTVNLVVKKKTNIKAWEKLRAVSLAAVKYHVVVTARPICDWTQLHFYETRRKRQGGEKTLESRSRECPE